MLLGDALMSCGASIAIGLLFLGKVPNAPLLAWVVTANIIAIAAASYLYRQVLKKDPRRYHQLGIALWGYRFVFSTFWAVPQYFAAISGEPTLYIFPAFIAGFALIFNAFVNLSLARYFAVFVPQIMVLLYVTTMLPEGYQSFSYLTLVVGLILIPIAFANEKAFFGYLGASGAALRYQDASAKAAQQVEHISLALGDSQKRLQLLADNAHDIIILHDTTGRYLFVSGAITDITGYYPSELIGKKPSDFVYHEDLPLLLENLDENGHYQSFNTPSRFRFLRKDGSIVWLESISRPVKSDDATQDSNLALVSTSRDISQQMAMEENLLRQAEIDALTGINNRAKFDQQLKALVHEAHENDAHHALIYIDLDQFKIINDSCGHQAGDGLLKEVARHLEKLSPDNSFVARLGGDEFAILLSNCSTNDASRVANKIRNHLAGQGFEVNKQFFSMAASFGIAIIDDQVASPEEALSRADVACYVAKAGGRNAIHLWLDGDSMVSRHTENIRLASKVKQALEHNYVNCFAQLVVPLQEKQPGAVHCEVLTNIELQDGEILTPDRYLPALERFGLSTDYDHYVVEATLKHLSEGSSATEMGWGWVSINLSAQTVCNLPSLEIIQRLFKRYNVSPTNVCFEITETAQLQNMRSALSFMRTLHDMGCMLALDDFGSGHSSFEHLLNLPFDIVKIDGQFIKDLTSNTAHQAIVKSICDLAEQLDILTVAEMVGDAATTKMLKDYGVNYGQGFYLAGRQKLSDLLATPAELLQLNPKVLPLFANKK